MPKLIAIATPKMTCPTRASAHTINGFGVLRAKTPLPMQGKKMNHGTTTLAAPK